MARTSEELGSRSALLVPTLSQQDREALVPLAFNRGTGTRRPNQTAHLRCLIYIRGEPQQDLLLRAASGERAAASPLGELSLAATGICVSGAPAPFAPVSPR